MRLKMQHNKLKCSKYSGDGRAEIGYDVLEITTLVYPVILRGTRPTTAQKKQGRIILSWV